MIKYADNLHSETVKDHITANIQRQQLTINETRFGFNFKFDYCQYR